MFENREEKVIHTDFFFQWTKTKKSQIELKLGLVRIDQRGFIFMSI